MIIDNRVLCIVSFFAHSPPFESFNYSNYSNAPLEFTYIFKKMNKRMQITISSSAHNTQISIYFLYFSAETEGVDADDDEDAGMDGDDEKLDQEDKPVDKKKKMRIFDCDRFSFTAQCGKYHSFIIYLSCLHFDMNICIDYCVIFYECIFVKAFLWLQKPVLLVF